MAVSAPARSGPQSGRPAASAVMSSVVWTREGRWEAGTEAGNETDGRRESVVSLGTPAHTKARKGDGTHRYHVGHGATMLLLSVA